MNIDQLPKTVTKRQLELAFEEWEKGVRINPELYRTQDEIDALGISEVSAERADYFFELLKLEQAKS